MIPRRGRTRHVSLVAFLAGFPFPPGAHERVCAMRRQESGRRVQVLEWLPCDEPELQPPIGEHTVCHMGSVRGDGWLDFRPRGYDRRWIGRVEIIDGLGPIVPRGTP